MGRNTNLPGAGLMKTGTGSHYSKDKKNRTGSGERPRSKSSKQNSRQNISKTNQAKAIKVQNDRMEGAGRADPNSNSSDSSIDGLPHEKISNEHGNMKRN